MSKNFYAKTNEGYTIKILAELLQNIIKTASFRVTHQGIFLRMFDSRECILVDVELHSDKFHKYELEEEFNIGINLIHFYRMLKSIKKKDELALYTIDGEPDLLYIEVYPKDHEGMSRSVIHAEFLQCVDITLPTEYTNPVIIPSDKYQRTIKEMINLGDGSIDILMKKYFLKISCESNQIYQSSVFFGDVSDESPDRFHQKFHNEFFTRTIKLTGLSSEIYVYGDIGLPLKLKTNAGHVGNVSIYINPNRIEEDN